MEPQASSATTAPPQQQKIVIVEDNQALAEIYKTRLEAIGYTCFIAYNGITGLYFIQKELPDLVLLDLMVPDIAGDQILTRMRGSTWGKDIKVYVISNLNENDAPKGLRDLGIIGYSVKVNMQNDDIDKIVNGILRPAPGPAAAPLEQQAAPAVDAETSEETPVVPVTPPPQT
jgi:DNA-binding response OmpR family regulator